LNLRPPPSKDSPDFDDWMQELYEFLKYPHFHQIRMVERSTASESQKGVFFLDSDDNIAKIHNGTDFQNLY
jgi:hypothetical protein